MKVCINTFLLGVSVTLLGVGCNRTSWPVSRELCGKVQVIDKQTSTILKNADLLLYRSKKRTQCCADAEMIASMRTDAEGNFNSGKLEQGRYFISVKDSPHIVFPVFLEKYYDGGTCSLNTLFSYDKNTGKTEQIVILWLKPQDNAQTH